MKSLALWSLCLLSLVGCAAVNAPVRHASDLSAYESFYVPAQADDSLGLAAIIAQRMKAAGLTCQTGQSEKAPASAEAVIRYRTELLPGNASRLQMLVLEVVDARSGRTAGKSRSDQPASLMPESNAAMADLAVRNLMAATPGPNGRPRGSLMERETLLW
jgi:hypothetical protein